jgi:RimJ/RimL family protein N-acetyltransferase
MIKITTYKSEDKEGIDFMMQEIADEFSFPISHQKAAAAAKLIGQYWVAFYGKEIIGTIGILKITDNSVVLKRMFVRKAFRGKDFGTAISLLQTVLNLCKQEKQKAIYLGTMEQFTAAQRFYEKNGFCRIFKDDLPLDFIINPVDTVFYKLEL